MWFPYHTAIRTVLTYNIRRYKNTLFAPKYRIQNGIISLPVNVQESSTCMYVCMVVMDTPHQFVYVIMCETQTHQAM